MQNKYIGQNPLVWAIVFVLIVLGVTDYLQAKHEEQAAKQQYMQVCSTDCPTDVH